MLNNQLRRQLLERHKQSGFPGSIIDVYKAYEQGVDIISNFEQQQMQQQMQQPQIAQTPQQQQAGLRPFHQAGNTSQSMIFPDVPPNTPFNTVGMKAPINIEKYDKQGHLVKSYENVPPGIENLPTGPSEGTILETPANMQSGGRRKYQSAGFNVTTAVPEWKATGPGMIVDGKLYQDTQRTGNTLIQVDPETGEQIPILLPTADVYPQEDSITGAMRKTGAGLFGSAIDKNQYNEIGDEIRSARDEFALKALSATGDIMSKPQQYLINAPLALAMGKKPNLSMFPSTDRLNGIDNGPSYPSQTLGITNPYGAMTVDILTDPSILSSFGVAGARGARKAANYIAKETALETLPKAKNIREAIGTLAGIPTERSLPRLSKEELKIFRQVQELGKMRATNRSISDQYRYALDQNIPDEYLKKIFRKTRTEIEEDIPNIVEQETLRNSIPIRERFNLDRVPRTSRNTTAGSDYDYLLERSETIEDILGGNYDLVIERNRVPITSSNVLLPNSSSPLRRNLIETARNDWQRYVDRKSPTSEVVKNRLTGLTSSHPYYKGPVSQNVPHLSLSSSGSLKNVSKKVEERSTEGVASGSVFTGSLNTSHSSYLPQIKQVFKYTKGEPQFLGYKSMNDLGFLNMFGFSEEDVARYLNTEIDQQISRGVLPKDILRPFAREAKTRFGIQKQVSLPHYGIKQFLRGGFKYPRYPKKVSYNNKVQKYS